MRAGARPHDLAVQYHREAIAVFDLYFDAPNLFSAFERAGLAKSLTALRRYTEAETVLLESLDLLEAIYDTEHEQVQKAQQRLADLYDTLGCPHDAVRFRRAAN